MLSVFVNNEQVYQCARHISLDEKQLGFLDKMDADMQRGIKLRGEMIESPSEMQCAQFVAMNLIKALQQDNEASIAVSCAYLINRHPDLIEVHVNDSDQGVTVELIQE